MQCFERWSERFGTGGKKTCKLIFLVSFLVVLLDIHQLKLFPFRQETSIYVLQVISIDGNLGDFGASLFKLFYLDEEKFLSIV